MSISAPTFPTTANPTALFETKGKAVLELYKKQWFHPEKCVFPMPVGFSFVKPLMTSAV